MVGDKQNAEASDDDADDSSEEEKSSDEYSSSISSHSVDSQKTQAQNDKNRKYEGIYLNRSFAKKERKIVIEPGDENNDDGDLGWAPRPGVDVIDDDNEDIADCCSDEDNDKTDPDNGRSNEYREAKQRIHDTSEMSEEDQ